MNYSKLLKGLVKEVFSFKQYGEFGMAGKVFAFVAVLPFIVLSTFALVFYVVTDFIYNVFASAVKYLECWVDDRKKGISPITEAVLFLVSMPWIFFCHVFLSFGAVFFYLIWFVAQCGLYTATLGGITWQPYINSATYEDAVEWEPDNNDTACSAVVMLSFGMMALYLLLSFVYRVTDNYDLNTVANNIILIQMLFTVVVFPIVFKKRIVDNGVDEDFSSDEDEDGDAFNKLASEKPIFHDHEREEALERLEAQKRRESAAAMPRNNTYEASAPLPKSAFAPRGRTLSTVSFDMQHLYFINRRFGIEVSVNETFEIIKEKLSSVKVMNDNDITFIRKIKAAEDFEEMVMIWEWFATLYS